MTTKTLGLLLTCLFFIAHSGHIYPQDIIINPNNKNTPSDITLIFSLDTSLASTDYLRIVFPFRLNSIQPAVWDYYSACNASTTGMKAIVTPSTLSGDSTSYFVQFYTDLTATTLSNLTSGTTFYLKITGTPDPSAQTGINLPIQLLTVSNNLGNWVIYDSNPVFGTVTLADAYPSTMTVTFAIPSTEVDYTVLGASYKVNIDITPKVTLKNRARVDIQLTNSDFALLSCKSLNSTADSIPLLPGTFDIIATNIIRATITKSLTAGNGAKYRFQCVVRNPTNTGTSKIIIKNRMGYVETITESGTDNTVSGLVASTTTASSTTTTSSGWDESGHKVQLGWGYDAHLAGALDLFCLYKDASPTERWYQSVQTYFKPSADMQYTGKVQVVVSTVNDASFKVLGASIYHNLPNSADANVICSVLTQGYLTCQNVAPLLGTQYFISFRFNILSTTTVNSVSDFGKVRVQTQATNPVDLIRLSATTLVNKNIRTNVALYTSSSTNGIIAYSTTKTSSTTTKYVTNDDNVILKFAFKYFTNAIIQLSLLQMDKGIELYTSPNLPSATSPTCSINTLTATTDVVITNCAVESQAAFTRLRFRIANFARITAGTPPYNLFTSSAQDGTIAFDNVKFNTYSSLNYVNANVFDYYARWVQDFTTVTNPPTKLVTGSAPFFFNSVVHKSGALANVNVGTTFFVTGATVTDPNNDGMTFPTMIRVTGYLTSGASGEQSGADRLLLFFNDLEPFNALSPCSGPSGISCKYVVNGADNTQTNTLTDYSGSRRIEIKVDFSQHFNIYIPVKTISQKASIGFFITTASVIDSASTAQGIYKTLHSKRIDQYTSSATTLTVDAVSASTPKISVTGSPTMGTIVDTSIGNLQSSYIQTTPNSGTLIGAAYAYCADYDFTTNAAFTFKPFYTSTAVAEQFCVTVKYSPSTTTDVTCQVCPVHSAMTTTAMPIAKLTLPTKAGRDFFDLTYVMGSNNGDFQKAAKDNQATVLTAFMLSGLGITFDPTDFKKASKNVYARITFTTSSALPKSIRINIIPTGSSTSLLVNPVASVSCIVNTTIATSCVTSGSTTNIQIDAVAQGNSWATGTHKIDFMIDADSTASAISADTTINFKATIKVNGLTALSALHHDSTATTFVIKNSASLYIGLYNITYLFGNKNARSVISFIFGLPSDIKMYPAQSLVFNLGGIAPANVGETPICLVKDPITGLTSNDFASCDVSDLTQLTLQAKAIVTGNYTLELQYIHVPSSAAPAGISGKVYAADGSTIVAQNLPSNPLTLPITPAGTLIPVLDVNLNRLYSDPGSVSEVVLSVKPSVNAISLVTHVYLYFPTYYADKLGYQNIWCTANDYPVSCSLMGSRIIHLSSFPVEVPVGQTLKIRVYGIITPVVPSNAGKIFIGLANTDSVFTLSEQLEVTDKASNGALPNALTIDGFTQTTQKIRETSDYTIIFTTDAVGIRSTRRIAIDFPDRYGNILGGNDPPIVLLSKTGDIITTPTSIQSTSIGSRFKITPPYDLVPKTSYTFVLKSLDNPEQPTCNMDKPVITITDSTESYAISRTAPNIWNVPRVDYTSDTNLKSLNWADKNGNTMIIIPLSIGIFSPEIRIIPPTGETFANDITFTNSHTQLSTLPTTVTGVKGTPYVSLRVSADSTTFPRIVLLDMKKDETYTTNVYAELPKLQLILTNTKNTLLAQTIRIVKGGTSLPYRWELDTLDLIPNTELKIDVSINQPTLSPLAVLGASSISFGPSTPKAGFTFTLTNAADASNPPSFTLTLGGQDSANYLLQNTTITVKVESQNTNPPALSGVVPAINYSPIYEQFSMQADQMVTVYWHVTYEGELMYQDCLRVRSKYNEGFTYDTLSDTQAQFGVFWVYTENVISLQTVSNLLSNEKYSYILCPANQLDVMGAPKIGTFQTKDNQARLALVTINFKVALTTSQLTSMVCLFTRELQLPDLNVVAMDGTTCTVPTVLSDKSAFDYKSITIYINGDRSSVFDSTTLTTLTQDVNSVSAQTTSSFLTTFNQALRGAGLNGQYVSISMASGVTYPLPTWSSAVNASAVIMDYNVTVNGLALAAPGMIYAIATEDTTTVPTTQEIKAKLNGKSVSVPGTNKLYTSEKGESTSLTLTGLKPNSDYLIYYYAASPDRTQYARSTEVRYLKLKTKPIIETVFGARTAISVVMTLAVSILALFL